MQAFRQFYNTHYGQPPTTPYSPQSIASFISYLDLHGRASSTIATHLSAIAHFHKLADMPDPTKHYLVRQVQLGGRRLHPSSDSRQAITKQLLHQLFNVIPYMATSPYMVSLFQSLFLLSFHAFLRAGEVTTLTSSGQGSQHTLTLEQIAISYLQGNPSALTISFNSYKHSNGLKPKLQIMTQTPPCPVRALTRFLQIRGTSPGFLFITPAQTPLTRDQFSSFLSTTLQYAGYDPSSYNIHSFRIGAATHAASQGCTPLQIRHMGRWKSDAFLKYIRHPTLQMV